MRILLALLLLTIASVYPAFAQTVVNQPPGPIPGADCAAGQSVTGWPAYGQLFAAHCGNGVASGVINTGTVGNFAVYTGTTTASSLALTAGSLPFAGSGGAATQDNGNLFYTSTGGPSSGPAFEVGSRTNQVIGARLEVASEAAVKTAQFRSIGAQGATGGATVVASSTPASGGGPITSGNQLGCYTFGGAYDSTNDEVFGSRLCGFATESFTVAHAGSSLVFQTIPNTTLTATTALTLGQDQSATFAGTVSAASFPSPTLTGTTAAPTPSAADSSTKIATTAFVAGSGFTLGSTAITLASGTVGTIAGLTLTSPTINSGALSGTFTGAPTFSGNVIFSGNPTLSGSTTVSGVPIYSGLSMGTQTSCLGLDSGNHLVINTPIGRCNSLPISSPLIGADSSGNPVTVSLGTNLSLGAGNVLNATGGGGGGSVTWPATGNLVISNTTNTPSSLAPVNNAVIVGSGGAWTTLGSTPSSVQITDTLGVPQWSKSLPSGLTIPGYLTGNQTVTLGGDAAGSGATAITVTNMKVNGVNYPSSPATSTVPVVTGSNQVTYDTASGLAAVSGFGTMLQQNASAVAITGGSITGLSNPSNPSDAATKAYVDAAAGGVAPHAPVAVATAAVLPNSPTYSNGSSGVGATLTAGSNVALVVDGVTVSTLTTRVLVFQQASGLQNGVYTLTQAGTGSVPWILTRATDFNTAASGNVATGSTVLVTGGATQINTAWSLSNVGAITIGTTALTFVQVGASTSYTADGTTISLSNNQFSALPNGILNAVSGTTNAILYKAGANWAAITPVNNSLIVTNGSGVPSETSTLPSGLTIPGYLTGNQTITLTGDTSGSGATAITTTTTKVNGTFYPSAPATATLPVITSSATASYLTAASLAATSGFGTMLQQNANAVAITGGSITGLGLPSVASDVATKGYVDSAVSGTTHYLSPVQAATVTVLPNTPTYANGTAGVGATLTAGSNAALVIDGYTVLLNDSVLIQNQAAGLQNGIYTQTQLGTGGAPYILTRRTDFDHTAVMTTGATVLSLNGTVNKNFAFTMSTTGTITPGTTSITFVAISGTNAYTADGTTIQLSGNQFSALPSGILNAISGTTNALVYKSGASWAGIAPVNSAVLVTSAGGVPSESTTLPAGLTIPGYLTANQSITLAGDLSGSGTTSITGTVLKVNGAAYPASPATNTVPTITSSNQVTYETAAGLAAISGFGTMLTQNASSVAITGGSITGLSNPVAASDVAIKSYVDGAVTGAILHTQVAAATPGTVLPNTPTGSGSGVGKTLTSSTNTALVVDGYTVLLNDRVLVKDQAAGSNNGIYTETQVGTGAVPWILTRATDFNTAAAGNVAIGAYVFVGNGTVNAGSQWQLGAPTPSSITVDTTALTFNKLNIVSTLVADGTTILNTGGTLSALPNGILSAVTATPNSLLARGASTWAGVAPVNNAVLTTNGSGVPSESTTLPSGLTIPAHTLSGTLTATGQTITGATLTSTTLTTPTINGAALSGTFSGTPTYSGVPIFSGLSAGTEVSCLGLDSGNHLVFNAAACGTGAGNTTDTVTTGIAAAGTTQGTATGVASQQNYVATGATCAPSSYQGGTGSCAGSAGVIFSGTMTVGQHFYVTNEDSTNALLFYPPSSATINLLAANAAIPIGPNTTAHFNIKSATALRTVP